MINHLTINHTLFTSSRELYKLIAAGKITLGGNKKLKIYGMLNCASGKRLKTQNRIFFESEAEAIANGYRPCGNCMRAQYELWKRNNGII